MTSNVAKQFFSIGVGSRISDGVKVYRVSHLISTDSVLAVDLATNESHRLAVDSLKLVSDEVGANAQENAVAGDRDLLDYSKQEWEEGQQRLKAIKPLLDNPLRTRQEVQRIALTNGVHIGTLYRWLAAYTDAGHVSALVPSKRGRKAGTKLLDDTLETILQSAIEEVYLHRQRHSPKEVIDEVERRCRLAQVAPPHANTVRNRIDQIPVKEQWRRRGRKDEAVNRFAPLRGSFPGADHPFAVVQIDHTPTDIICVDDVLRKPVARPYLTLAIDVHTRMVAGFYLSYDPPGAASVGLCLAQAMCPKREYLAELGVGGSWPVWGRIGTVHCDNAKEFRGAALERACAEHGIDLAWRPVKVPRYGGHIERMMGTVAKELHKLPGTTFSNTRDRKGYDSTAEASLTLKELERHLAEYFVNVYHQSVHSQISMSPLRKWELGLAGDMNKPGLGLMPLPQDPDRIVLDFMPFVERTVQPYGLQIDKINYYDPVLDPYINATDADDKRAKKMFIVRRDPRDVSRVYFFDPGAKRYCVIPYRDLAHPAMSLYELREARRILEQEGRRDIDETLIFDALDRMRTRVDEATHKSKAARRHVQRSPRAADRIAKSKPHSGPAGGVQPLPPPLTLAVDNDDPFAQPVRPFEELGLKR